MRRLFWFLFTLGFCVGLYFGLKEGRRAQCQIEAHTSQAHQ